MAMASRVICRASIFRTQVAPGLLCHVVGACLAAEHAGMRHANEAMMQLHELNLHDSQPLLLSPEVSPNLTPARIAQLSSASLSASEKSQSYRVPHHLRI